MICSIVKMVPVCISCRWLLLDFKYLVHCLCIVVLQLHSGRTVQCIYVQLIISLEFNGLLFWCSGQKDNIFGSDSSWFAFQDDTSRSKEDSNIKYLFSTPSRNDDGLVSNAVSSPSSSGDSSSDDEVVLGEDEDLADTASSASASLNAKIGPNLENGLEMESPTICSSKDNELSSKLEKVDLSDNSSLCQQREEDNLPGCSLHNVADPF